MQRKNRTLHLVIVCAVMVVALCPCSPLTLAQGHERSVVIGVVRDGPSPGPDLGAAIEQELTNHLPRRVEAVFVDDPALGGGGTIDGAKRALERALADPEIDIVLLLGPLATLAAADDQLELTKPVVSSFVQRDEVFDLPWVEGDRSGKPNLSYLKIPKRGQAEIRQFYEMIGFDTLHIAAESELVEAVQPLLIQREVDEAQLDIDIDLLPLATDPEAELSRLPSEVEAVYFGPVPQWSADDRRRFIEALNDRGIPVFSMSGHQDVHLGALAALTPDIHEEVVRRVALNLSQLLRGGAWDDLPVVLAAESRLLVNARTAARVGYRPDRQALAYADFLHAEALERDAKNLSFAELLTMAETGNTALTITDAQVQRARAEQSLTRSPLLPQIGLGVDYTRIDPDTEDSINFPNANFRLSQQIYDDRAWATHKRAKRLTESKEYDFEANRLDVLADAGRTYYELALWRALLKIESSNLQRTLDFLELARLRKYVGYSGRDEILRWEAAVAESRTGLFRNLEQIERVRIALNQILGIDQRTRWVPEPEQIASETFHFLDGRLDPMFDNPAKLELLRDYLVGYSQRSAPTLKAVDKEIEAQDVELSHLKRRWWLPTFSLSADYTSRLSGDGNNTLLPFDEWYTVQVGLTYPIFEGLGKKYQIRRARWELEGLSRESTFVDQKVEQRTRTAIRACENSFPRIRFTREAAAAADENLELVRDKYTLGLVNVTDVIDARNQAFVAEQTAATAEFEFLTDLVDLQRAISWFAAEQTEEQQDAFVEGARQAASNESAR